MSPTQTTTAPIRYRRGDLVEVRSLDEILDTLDADGKLEGMAFMPEMARYCGGRFAVYRRASKTCVEGVGMRWLEGAVFLEGLRCDGAMHDGCQRGCLYFWKEAWLKPAVDNGAMSARRIPSPPAALPLAGEGSMQNLPTTKGGRYYCQSTELLGATTEFPRWNLRHYWHDLRDGETSPRHLLRVLWRVGVNKVRRWSGDRPGTVMPGQGAKPSKGDLNLLPGEWVEVKSRKEIAALVDAAGTNRGLGFEIEMLDHCGRRLQVAYPIRKIILEQTGQMMELTNTVVLDGIVCRGLCAKNCPRSNYFYWRESWLRRV